MVQHVHKVFPLPQQRLKSVRHVDLLAQWFSLLRSHTSVQTQPDRRFQAGPGGYLQEQPAGLLLCC